MFRFLCAFFLSFFFCQSLSGQRNESVIDVLEYRGQNSTLLDWQLRGLIAGLNDSSFTTKEKSLYRLMETPWEGHLPTNILDTIITHIDTIHKSLIISILKVLSQQQDSLSNSILNRIVDLLKDTDGGVRSSAANALDQRPSLFNIYSSRIVDLLQDSNGVVRSTAVNALGKQNRLPKTILSRIADLLKDSVGVVRSSAAIALGKQEHLPDVYISRIADLLKDSEMYVCISAANALGQQKNLSDVYLSRIADLLKDSDYHVRRSAVNALGQQDRLSEAYLSRITDLFKDSDYRIRSSAASVLRRQNSLSDAILSGIADLLKNSKGYVRSLAVNTLGHQNSFSDAILSQIADLLKDSDGKVRSSTANALGKQKNLSDAYLRLLAELLNDSESSVRSSAADALGQQDGLSDVYISRIAELLNDSESSVRSSAADALGQQNGLSDVYVGRIAELLKDPDRDVLSSAADALGQQNGLSDVYISRIAELLKDRDRDVRGSAANALGTQNGLSDVYLKRIIPLLKDSDSRVRNAAWQSLHKHHSIHLAYLGFPYAAEHALKKNEDSFAEPDAFQLRVPLYEFSGGNDSILYLMKWLCRPLKYPKEVSIQEARETLDLILGLEVNLDSFPLFKKEMGLALPELIKSVEGQWSTEDIPNLKLSLAFIEQSNPKNAPYIQGIIKSIQTKSWLYQIALFLGIHLFIWGFLIFVYPYSIRIQEIFFWNSKVRNWGGLGYISELIVLLPLLRRRLFSPYRETLIGEVYTGNWQAVEYYPESLVYGRKEKATLLITEALQPLKGQKILEGESGLGKSMFLRNFAVHSVQIIAYLPATSCTQGLIPALLQKVPCATTDLIFFKRLIYAGAVDILIDGLNEISSEARSRIKLEVELSLKGNILLTTQPMEWEPPVSTQKYILKPLEEKQVEQFLLSRYSFLEQKNIIPTTAFEAHAKDYLVQAFDSKQDTETLKSNRQILSNPMDLTLVAQLIARGEKPSLLDLQQQQYALMAQDYKLKNLNNEFPLAKFASYVYALRLGDQAEISNEDFKAEIQAMEKWKMVVSRSEEKEGKTIEKWYFRHDKIMDYFLAHEFLTNDELAEKHLNDPRFRGVYFLLAYRLEYRDAMKLRELLIQHAAESKDHSLSDEFIMLLRGKKEPRADILQVFREEIKVYISQGEYRKAMNLLKEKANRQQEQEVVLLNQRNTKLEEEIRQGTISTESAFLERNKLNKAILELSVIIE